MRRSALIALAVLATARFTWAAESDLSTETSVSSEKRTIKPRSERQLGDVERPTVKK
jgi:hypothetical protein